MCYQLIERYSSCHCIYYQHAVDRCPDYGRPGHHVITRTILVGYACHNHTGNPTDPPPYKPRVESPPLPPQRPRPTLKQAINKIRKTENEDVPEARESRALGSIAPRPAVPEASPPTSPNVPSVGDHPKPVGKPDSVPPERLGSQDQTVRKPESVVPEQLDSRNQRIYLEISDDDRSTVQSSVFDGGKGKGKSSVTSTQTYEPLNAIELLTSELVYDKYLQYLWPQFFLRSDSKDIAQQHISRLIYRYSLDLQNSAKGLGNDWRSVQKLEVGRFIERKRRVLAQEICREFQLPDSDGAKSNLDPPFIQFDKSEEPFEVENEATVPEPAQFQNFNSLKSFLFSSDPFFSFRKNVRWLVEEPLQLPLHVQLVDSMRLCFENIWFSITASKLTPGKQRAHYTCQCGQKLYDDYVESRSGALDEFKSLLAQCGFKVQAPGDLESNDPPRAAPAPVNNTRKRKATGNKYCDIRLPYFWQKQAPEKLGICRPRSTGAPAGNHNYVLACLPFGRLVSRLHQPEVCTIDSDQDFFSLLRVTYRGKRARNPLTFLRRVTSIHFVQFEVYNTDIADVRSHPTLPPGTLSNQYTYDPVPPDLMPPIGSKLLVHLMENPTHASVLPELYKGVPKKLREKLSPCPRRGTSDGWGLAFNEGVDIFMFFLYGCAGFLVCLAAALIWTTIRNDIQGGTGLGAFLLTFMVFCGGLVHSSVTSNTLS
ncbi:hypothetical protein M426DRAFT_321063 [Hypoxylon sp. CI-4A]|nr:hypothetical protein M426DRAFT_321063 [Hypoxylon sp. CI-4A]